ncbi:DUF5689 domain-containing protein [Chryseobacterium salipaludis]|uniref:DUF5689 domain-containing protein n=1 Tax=Chryseobacterium TaxID=59732 RepID=UPI001FF5D2E3|nr:MULTISPECIES: DUF5689 domain-containing protein [Chryseobacterium]MCJ8497218.1 DUF5689 domain-containing protein [Chryseobacterium salipaludis]MCX3295625.1 DUF5689 domain-containing protein [Planobacterium sp. JC490]
MNLKQYFKTAFIVACSALAVTACVDKDEWETPPINCNNKFDAPTKTLAEVKAMAPSSGYLLIEDDLIFDGYIISSDENGNFYKSIVFQDKPENPTAGLQMEVDRSSNYADFPVGMHVRINAKGLRLGLDRGTVKLGSVDPTYNIGRIPSVLLSRYISAVCDGNNADIATIKPVQLSKLSDAKNEKYINTLVSVSGVQFEESQLNKQYIDYVNGEGKDTNRALQDLTGGTAPIRSSGFAKYGSALLPTGSGTVTFVVSRYNSEYQMLIRGLNDVQLNDKRLAITVETFESYTSGTKDFGTKYYNTSVTGSRLWEVREYSSNKYIQISGLNQGLVKTHFAVPVNFDQQSKLSFKTNAGYYNGETLSVYYSTNYNPANPGAATLVDITDQFDISKGKNGPAGAANYEDSFRPSGTGTFTAQGEGYIIFEYNSNSVNNSGVSTVMQLDDININ